MNAVDTNVLIYAHDSRDPVKQEKAVALIGSLTDGVLLWQVACEYIAASRKLVAYGFSQQQAFADLQQLQMVWRPFFQTGRFCSEPNR
jgi:predicted nucleic acid-binding protein